MGDVRTVVVRSPSLTREVGTVLRVLAHVVFWSTALLGAAWHRTRSGPGGATATGGLAVDEVTFRDLRDEDQRMYRQALEGITEAEDVRSRSGTWPDVAELAKRGIQPFAADPLDRAGYTWARLPGKLLVNYVGTPVDAKRPTLLVVALEPDPGSPADPGAVVNETHHRLGDGTMIHVGIWTGGKRPDAAIALPAYEDGWRRITSVAK